MNPDERPVKDRYTQGNRFTIAMYASFYPEDRELLDRLAKFYGSSLSDALRTSIRSYGAFLRQQAK